MKPVKVVTWFSIVLAVLLLFTIGAVTFSIVEVGKANERVCRQTNAIQGEIRGVLERSKAALPRNAYFKEHPDQLAAAQRQVADELRSFGPLRC